MTGVRLRLSRYMWRWDVRRGRMQIRFDCRHRCDWSGTADVNDACDLEKFICGNGGCVIFGEREVLAEQSQNANRQILRECTEGLAQKPGTSIVAEMDLHLAEESFPAVSVKNTAWSRRPVGVELKVRARDSRGTRALTVGHRCVYHYRR